MLHGSQNGDIDIVEPRQAVDKRAYSAQRAIYATTDGIWVIYFAILDRARYTEMSMFNNLDLVAVAPGKRLAAFCIGWLDAGVGNKLGGQVEPFGVHP